MTIFLGANDSNSFELNQRQHVPLDEYEQNLKDMIDFAMVSFFIAILSRIAVLREKNAKLI